MARLSDRDAKAWRITRGIAIACSAVLFAGGVHRAFDEGDNRAFFGMGFGVGLFCWAYWILPKQTGLKRRKRR